MTPLCPVCGYDRSGDRSDFCPECGTPRSPDDPPATSTTPELLAMLHVCTTMWLIAYITMVSNTYQYGTWPDSSERFWRVVLTVFVGLLVSASVLLERRRAVLAQIYLFAFVYQFLATLLILLLGAGLCMTFIFMIEPPRQ